MVVNQPSRTADFSESTSVLSNFYLTGADLRPFDRAVVRAIWPRALLLVQFEQSRSREYRSHGDQKIVPSERVSRGSIRAHSE